MNRTEILRQLKQSQTLQALGFTDAEADALRRISMTLQRWYERECNGEVRRGDDGIARGYRVNGRFLDPNDPRYWYSIPDRETGALKRLAAIIQAHNERGQEDGPYTITRNPQVSTYLQTDGNYILHSRIDY